MVHLSEIWMSYVTVGFPSKALKLPMMNFQDLKENILKETKMVTIGML